MSYPSDLKYSKEHEWVRVDGDVATVGITHHAQDALGDIVFVDLPEVGDDVAAGDSIAEIESVKAVSDIYSPLTGTITEVNEELDGNEEVVNSDPHAAGWIFKMSIGEPAQLDGLMDAAAYAALTEEG